MSEQRDKAEILELLTLALRDGVAEILAETDGPRVLRKISTEREPAVVKIYKLREIARGSEPGSLFDSQLMQHCNHIATTCPQDLPGNPVVRATSLMMYEYRESQPFLALSEAVAKATLAFLPEWKDLYSGSDISSVCRLLVHSINPELNLVFWTQLTDQLGADVLMSALEALAKRDRRLPLMLLNETKEHWSLDDLTNLVPVWSQWLGGAENLVSSLWWLSTDRLHYEGLLEMVTNALEFWGIDAAIPTEMTGPRQPLFQSRAENTVELLGIDESEIRLVSLES